MALSRWGETSKRVCRDVTAPGMAYNALTYCLASRAVFWYNFLMATVKIHIMPSPLPASESERNEWNALTREEQVARYREYLSQPECDRLTSVTMADILTEARAEVAARRHA